MSDDFPRGENVVFITAADVVNDKRPAARVGFVGNDADVIESVGELPRHDVARFPLRSSTRCDLRRQRFAKAPKVNDLIGHAAMIDVFVEFLMLVLARIRRGKTAFVFVNQALQIESDGAQRANNHIGASASAARHVTVRVAQRNVTLVIQIANLRARCGHNSPSARVL